ncbi:MAG: sulfotransferase [Maritimibacter sp.]
MTISIGLGSGRSGTHSLADLINHQSGAMCFHELAPSCMSWHGAERNVSAVIKQFQHLIDHQQDLIVTDMVGPDHSSRLSKIDRENIHTVGDVALYYLPYVRHILSIEPQAKFPCMKRDRDETVFSFTKKLNTHGYSALTKFRFKLSGKSTHRNPWSSENDTRWVKNHIWDRLFPSTKTNSTSLEDYVADWYDYYYSEVEALMEIHPKSIEIFPTTSLNSDDGQSDILKFCGLTVSEDSFTHVHSNKSSF